MQSYSQQSLKQALKNQVRRLQYKIETLEKRSNQLSMARLATFVGGLVAVYFIGRWAPEWVFWVSVAAFVIGFWRLVRWHRDIDQTKEQFTIWQSIRSRHLARSKLDWSSIPEREPTDEYSDHPFAYDLNILGKHSLLSLLDTSNYPGSTDRLAAFLLDRNPAEETTDRRQAIVRELVPNTEFRDRLHLYAELYKKQELETDWSLSQLQMHLNNSEKVNYSLSLWILGSLAAANMILGGLYLAGLINPYVIITFVLYLVVYNFNSGKISGLYDESTQIEKLLSRFNAILGFLERYDYEDDTRLKAFCRVFWASDYSPSKYVHRIVRLAGAASSQQSEVIWVLLNFLVPWDLYFAQKLSSYKQELAPRLAEWVDHVYELEAYSSMANFAWLHPHYTFSLPEANASEPFSAIDLGHPLLPADQKVTNNMTIGGKGDILLITGSNMAGKSTFLRTMGINLALCFAGAPVNASQMSTIPFRIFSSINVTDSLDDGLSHFYAEVKRLRELLNLLEDDHQTPVFFLVDEIYRGTNNRERMQGSEAFLKKVAGKNGVGLVSTHDLELSQLEESIPELSNWHFAETIEGGKMRFEYKIKPGPCPTTNALKIMEMEGLPV